MNLIKSSIILILIPFLPHCTTKNTTNNTELIVNDNTDSTFFSEIETFPSDATNYLENKDFDGDSIADYLAFDYTGGAHCCYKMVLKISSLADTIHYPFEMDGGFLPGILSDSDQGKFEIADFDQDGLPEIFMEISTYNGKPNPDSTIWMADFGISGNYIIFDFKDDSIVLSNYDSTVFRY